MLLRSLISINPNSNIHVICMTYAPFSYQNAMVAFNSQIYIPLSLVEVHVEIFLKENAIAKTCPRFIWVGYGNVEVSEQLQSLL